MYGCRYLAGQCGGEDVWRREGRFPTECADAGAVQQFLATALRFGFALLGEFSGQLAPPRLVWMPHLPGRVYEAPLGVLVHLREK